MVLPMGGMGMSSMMTGPPTDGVLKLLPWLKLALAGLGLAVMMELVAGLYSAALTDLLTLVMGLLLFRNMLQLNRCLLYFTFMAGMNLFYATFLLGALLSAPFPGAKNFLSADCVPVEVRGHQYKCTWQTALGDAAVLLAVFFEFLCVVLGYRMLSLTRRAMEERFAEFGGVGDPLRNLGAGAGDMMLPMYAARARDFGGGNSNAAGFDASFGASDASSAAFAGGAEYVGTANAGGASSPSRVAAPAAGASAGGFTPFSGQAHRLGDD